MARLYTYGILNRVANVPGVHALPGTYVTAQGVQYGEGAFDADATNDLDFGEPVEITAQTAKGIGVKRATSSLTAATLAFVIRDIVGVRTIQAGIAEKPSNDQGFTVVKASNPNSWDFVVPLVAGVTPAVGGTVYIGLGTNGTVLGGVYATAQGAGGADSIDSGLIFKSLKFTPTSSTGICAWIGK